MSQDDQETLERAMILEGPKPKGVTAQPYRAYDTVSVPPHRLIIYAKTIFMMPRYDLLDDVRFDGAGEYIGLAFRKHIVRLYGRHLMGLVDSLRTHRVDWVREYAPVFFTLPDDPGAAVIESIEIDPPVMVVKPSNRK